MDIRQIIREELLRIEGSDKPYVNNYGLPDWFNLLEQYKKLEKRNGIAEETLYQLVELMQSDIYAPEERIDEYHRILSNWAETS